MLSSILVPHCSVQDERTHAMVTIITMTVKGAIRDFFLTISSCLQRTLKWTGRVRAQSTYISGARHLQQAACPPVPRESSAVTEIASTIALFHRLKPLTVKRGEETEVPGETPYPLPPSPHPDASENATYKSSKIQAPSETRTHSLTFVTGVC